MKKIYLILIIAIILTYILPIVCKYENFEVVSYNVNTNNMQQYKSVYDKTEKEYESDISFTKHKHIKCCLVENKLDNDKFSYQYKQLEDDNCDLKLYDTTTNKTLLIEGDNGWDNKYCKPSDIEEFTENINGEYNFTSDDTIYAVDDSLKNIQFIKETPKPTSILLKYSMILKDMEKNIQQNIEEKNDIKKNIKGSCRFANKECINFIDKKTCDKLNLQWSEKSCYEMLPFKFVDKVKIHAPTFEDGGGVVNLFPVPDVPINCSDNTSSFPPTK